MVLVLSLVFAGGCGSKDLETTTLPLTSTQLTTSGIPTTTGPAPEAPVVIETVPKNNSVDIPVYENTIKFVFSQPMDREATISALSIKPEVCQISDLIIEWQENDTILLITFPNDFDQGRQYKITISKSAMSPAGVHMEEDFVLTFHTPWV